MRATLLTWNMPEEHMGRLRYLCLRLGAELRPVGAGECDMQIARICGLRGGPSEEPLPFQETMLLMAGFTGGQMDSLLDGLRQAGIRVPLKAVLTETNRRWDSLRLHNELMAERQALEEKKPR